MSRKDYKGIKRLGNGSFGDAWLCKKKDTGVKMVMKILHRDTRPDRVKFENEARLLCQLNHPNIVKYEEFFVDGDTGKYCLVMEYCSGGDLARRINHRKLTGSKFAEQQIVKWTREICMALQHIHGKGIIHRDLKPPNIFLTSSESVKIGDFGVSRQLDPGQLATSFNTGTILYMSPEMVSGTAPYGCKTDVWSLGCCVYELMTLRTYIDKREFVNRGLRQESPMPPDFSDYLTEITRKMVTVEVDRRISVDEILASRALDLQRFSAAARATSATASSDSTDYNDRDDTVAASRASPDSGDDFMSQSLSFWSSMTTSSSTEPDDDSYELLTLRNAADTTTGGQTVLDADIPTVSSTSVRRRRLQKAQQCLQATSSTSPARRHSPDDDERSAVSHFFSEMTMDSTRDSGRSTPTQNIADSSAFLSLTTDSNGEDDDDANEKFGYRFNRDGQLRDDSDQPFKFDVYGNHRQNQERYEELCEWMIGQVRRRILDNCKLKFLLLPLGSTTDIPHTFVFTSANYDRTTDRLLLLIHGAVARAGIWSRRFTINDCLDVGTQIPYIKRALQEGYEVIVLNTNLNSWPDARNSRNRRPVPNNSTPAEHLMYVWQNLVLKSRAKHVAVIGHSNGGRDTVHLMKQVTNEFLRKVFGVALTVSAHDSTAVTTCSAVLKPFIASNMRNWVTSSRPINTRLSATSHSDIPEFSAGTTVRERTPFETLNYAFEYLHDLYLLHQSS